jgi:hypothetical protein
LERLSGDGFTVRGVVGGSSRVWYSEDPGLEELSAQKIPILLELAPVWRVFYCEGNLSMSVGTPQSSEWSWQGNSQLYYRIGRGVHTWQGNPQRIL